MSEKTRQNKPIFGHTHRHTDTHTDDVKTITPITSETWGVIMHVKSTIISVVTRFTHFDVIHVKMDSIKGSLKYRKASSINYLKLCKLGMCLHFFGVVRTKTTQEGIYSGQAYAHKCLNNKSLEINFNNNDLLEIQQLSYSVIF